MSRKSESKKVREEVKAGIKPENYFILCSGGVLKDIKELAGMFDHLSDDEFRCHVNDEKNDFANWIRDVFGEKELAEKLMPVKDKKDVQIILLKFLVNKG